MLETVQTWVKMRKAQLREVNEPQANLYERLTKRKRLPNDRQTTTKRHVSWILSTSVTKHHDQRNLWKSSLERACSFRGLIHNYNGREHGSGRKVCCWSSSWEQRSWSISKRHRNGQLGICVGRKSSSTLGIPVFSEPRICGFCGDC